MRTSKTTDYLKECIADAVILLLKEKSIEKISVDEIVKKAGVGRATYFRSFSSKSEAISFKLMKMWKQYCELNDIEISTCFNLNNAEHFFAFIYSIRHILEIINQAGLQESVHQSLCSFMPKRNNIDNDVSTDTIYRKKFYAHGLYGLFDEWMKRGFSEPPNVMSQRLMEIISTPYTQADTCNYESSCE